MRLIQVKVLFIRLQDNGRFWDLYFAVYFVVLKIEEEAEVPYIIGRLFILTSRVNINLEIGELMQKMIIKIYDGLKLCRESLIFYNMYVRQTKRDVQESPLPTNTKLKVKQDKYLSIHSRKNQRLMLVNQQRSKKEIELQTMHGSGEPKKVNN